MMRRLSKARLRAAEKRAPKPEANPITVIEYVIVDPSPNGPIESGEVIRVPALKWNRRTQQHDGPVDPNWNAGPAPSG